MSYNPASTLTTTGSLAHLGQIHYRTKALDQLKAKFRFLLGTEPDSIPQRSGKTIQWYRYGLLTANSVPSSEGTVGAAITPSTSVVTATVSEYSDFITYSSLLKETAIDPVAANYSAQLGYRAALSVDGIVRTEFDSVGSAVEFPTLGATITVQDFRRMVALLGGINAGPKMGDDWVGIIHPYVRYDLQADNTAGGFIDVLRYADPQSFISGEVGKIAGVRLFETTNVKIQGTAPNQLYSTYVIGEGAVGAVDLAGRGPSKVQDADKQSFKINVGGGGPQLADPEGMIGGFVSYRYVFVTKILDSTNYRFRIILADPSLV
jgi:N4-gp56 family major capsid protein